MVWWISPSNGHNKARDAIAVAAVLSNHVNSLRHAFHVLCCCCCVALADGCASRAATTSTLCPSLSFLPDPSSHNQRPNCRITRSLNSRRWLHVVPTGGQLHHTARLSVSHATSLIGRRSPSPPRPRSGRALQMSSTTGAVSGEDICRQVVLNRI